MGAVEELLGLSQERGLQGTLTGTLGEADAGTPGADVVPAPPSRSSPFLTAEEAADAPPPAATPFPTELQGNRAFVVPRETEEGFGEALAGAARFAGRPIKGLLDLLGNLDRPQQFLFGTIVRGLETGSFAEGLETGFRAATTRRPVPGGPKRRIEPEEVINAVGESLGLGPTWTDSMHPLAKNAASFGLLFGLDPLIAVPGAFYSKSGRVIKQVHGQILAADRARKTASLGTSVEHVGHIIRSGKIEEELQLLGRQDGVLGMVMDRVGSDLDDVELALVRDYLTGVGVEGIVGTEVQRVLASGELQPERVARLLEKVQDVATEADIDRLAGTIDHMVAAHRNSSDNVMRYLIRGKVGKKRGTRVASLEQLAAGKDFNRELLVGQLINRFGLLPSVAVQRGTLSAARREIGRQARERGVRLAEEGLDPRRPFDVDLVEAWNGLSQKQRARALERPGRRDPESAKKLVDRKFDDIVELQGAVGMDGAERQAIIDAFVHKRLGQADVKISPRQFLERIVKPNVSFLPPKASRSFKEALGRTVTEGPFVVDAIVASRLASRFPAVERISRAGREAAELAAGVRKPDSISDLPDAASHFETVSSILSTDKRVSKDMTMLGFMFEPKQQLPTGIFALLKSREDEMRAVGNALNERLDEILTYQSKPIRRGSETAKLLAVSMSDFGDRWKDVLGMTSKEARNKIKDLNDGGELFRIQSDLRAYFNGFAEAMTRKGVAEIPVNAGIDTYFPRIYPDFQQSVKEAVSLGWLSADDGSAMLRRASNQTDKTGFLAPMELDFVDKKSVFFRHFLRRKLDEPLPGASADIVDALNAYTQGALRKIYMEPTIKQANELGRELPRFRKRYLSMLLKRLRGAEVLEEESLNAFVNTMREGLGLKATVRPATRIALSTTRMFYRGLLGGNVGFFLKNLTQGINNATEAGPLNALRGISVFASNPIMGKDAAGKVIRFRDLRSQKQLMADFRTIMEKNEGLGRQWVSKLDDFLFQPAHASEYWNRGTGMAAGMTQRMKELGHRSLREMFESSPDDFADAVRFGHATANETQFVYGVLGRSPVAGSPLGRLGLQFFSWPVKQAQFLRNGLGIGEGRGIKDIDLQGLGFLYRYVAFSGMLSKIAEHAEVDAGSFLGFGFFPSQASPSFQAMGHFMAGVEAAVVEDDAEGSRRHFQDVARQLENLVPAFLQIDKLSRAVASAESGVIRGTRGRFQRRTDDPARAQPLSQVLDATVNPVSEALGLPELSGEQFVAFTGLPSAPQSRFRELTKKLARESSRVDAEARRLVDDYIEAYGSGDFVRADEVRRQAFTRQIWLTPDVVKRELANKSTGAVERQIQDLRASAEQRIIREATEEFPDIMRHHPESGLLPPTPIDNTR